MLAHERSSHNVKLLECYYPIHLCFSRQKCQQIDEQRWTSIVWNSNQIVETLAGPVFAKHLFLRDQNNIATLFFAFTNKISTFEISCEADDVEGAIHFVFSFQRRSYAAKVRSSHLSYII